MATIDPRAFAEPCGCGTPAGEDCPHTPIRCKHNYWYGPVGSEKQGNILVTAGMERTCEWCGKVERATMTWATERSAYREDSPLVGLRRVQATQPKGGE